jgi:hypothetical protein
MKVILRALSRHPWSGIIRYRNCHDSIGTYFTRSGRLYTGLSREDAERLGELLHYDLSPSSDFWHTFYIRMTEEDNILDTEDPMDELRYLFLKGGHKRIATSLDDRKPTANYVLINQHEEAKKANTYNRTKRKALAKLDKMTISEMRKALRVYGHRTDNISDEQVENRMTDLVESNPQRFFTKWVDNKNRQTEWLVKEAVAKNVIRKNKNIHKYGSEVLGGSLEETVYFLDNAENQDLKKTIINETEVK